VCDELHACRASLIWLGEVRCPQRKVVIAEGWICAENLRPFAKLLAFLAGYTLYDQEYDGVALEYGVKDTDVDAGKWYTYAFAGTATAHAPRSPGRGFERRARPGDQ